jgi:hypothetical protein
MKPLDPSFARGAPEVVVLDILSAMIDSAIISLLAAHSCIEQGEHPAGWCVPGTPSTCCRADAIIELLYQLDNAIIAYFHLLDIEINESIDTSF